MLNRDVIWAEKYRPQNFGDLVLPKALKEQLEGIVTKGELPNVTFVGPAGVGKTSVAKVLAASLGADVFFVNASLNGNIDMLRTDIAQFASAMSLSGLRKIVILDEADALSRQAQEGLRAFMEEAAASVGFIMTANAPNKIHEALLSRCPPVMFKWAPDDVPLMMAKFLKRTFEILAAESVAYNEKVVVSLLRSHFPDYRKLLGVLQFHSSRGSEIDVGCLTKNPLNLAHEVIPALRKKDTKTIMSWVNNNQHVEMNDVFRDFFDEIEKLVVPKNITDTVLIIGNYMRDADRVADPRIHLTCFFFEVMTNAEWLKN